MTTSTECKSGLRDKNHHCVDCGKEVFDGIADIILIDSDGKELQRKQKWISGHID